MRCDNGISLEQQNSGEILQYHLPLRNTESPDGDYTQSRDDEYALNRAKADAWLSEWAIRQQRSREPNGVPVVLCGRVCLARERLNRAGRL
jgi:hypothetical protein